MNIHGKDNFAVRKSHGRNGRTVEFSHPKIPKWDGTMSWWWVPMAVSVVFFFFFRIFEGPQNRQFHLVIVCSLWNHPCLFAADWKTNAEVPQVRMQKRQRNDSFTYSVEVPWSYGHIVSSIHPTASRVKIRQEKQWHKHREHLPKVSSSQFFLPSKWILTHFSNFHGLPPQKARPALPSCHEKRLCRHPVLRHHCHVSDRGRCWPPDRVRDAVSRTGAFSVSAEMAGNGTIVLFFMYQSL